MLHVDNELYVYRNQEISYLQEQFQKKKTKNKFNPGVEHRREKWKRTNIKTSIVKMFISLKVIYIVHIISTTAKKGKSENSYATNHKRNPNRQSYF